MSLNSLQFVGFLLVVILALHAINSTRPRSFLIAAFNIIFILSFTETPLQLLPILIFAAIGYCAIVVVGQWNSKLVRFSGLVLILGGFIWLKQYSVTSFVPALPSPYIVVGLSYILFRVLHLLIDVSQGAQRTPGPLAFFNYIFFFLTYTSGPIQRYQDFSSQLTKPRLSKTKVETHRSLDRLINGFLLVVVISPITSYLSEKFEKYFFIGIQSNHDLISGCFFGIAAICHLLHLYINFAGYMGICIGFGRLIGHQIPENFDAPYNAKNFLDFWSRWHITLSEWFKFYLFNTLLKSLMGRYSQRSNTLAPYFAAIAFFVTFMTMGFWHGTSNIFLFYGLLLGSGVTINKLWQVFMEEYLGRRKYKTLSGRLWYSQLSRSLALSFFSLSLTCIWISSTQVTSVGLSRLLTYGLLGLIAVTVFLFVALWLLDVAISWIRKIAEGLPVGNATRVVIGGLKLIVLVNFAVVTGSEIPPFIYEGF